MLYTMRIRVRGPQGQSVITLADTATVEELRAQISKTTSIKSFEVKYGYPPKPLELAPGSASLKLSDLGINLNGEQLIVSEDPGSVPSTESRNDAERSTKGAINANPIHPSRPAAQSTNHTAGQQLLPAHDEDAPTDAPELPLPSHASTLVLRIMPDDNSCLFRAFNAAYFRTTDNMHSLRSIIAQHILAHPDTYPRVVLDKDPAVYCRWIQSPDAWGGAIELDILSRHFDIEICSIDVQTLRIDRFNEGMASRCVLVYSGIHYDMIALSPSEPPSERANAPPEFDVTVFDAGDQAVLEKAVELCRVLQGRHYFTDTAAFSVRCQMCGGMFRGEREATQHAAETGHYEFGEGS